MRIFPSRAAVAVVVGAFILTACSDGGGPASVPAATARHPHDAAASPCTTVPVNGLQVTTTSMTLAPNGSGQFTACTQYASTYAITVSPSGVLTAPSSSSTVTAMVQPSTIKAATITVTAGATACQNATITLKDKKNNKKTVSVHVLCSQPFGYTGAVQTFNVPSGVTNATITAVGAEGATYGPYYSSGCFTAGVGASITATIPVTPSATLYVYVGGSGRNNPGGFNGGGGTGARPYNAGTYGGGASDVRTSNQYFPSTTKPLTGDATTDPRLIVAGGGGSIGYPCEAGGNAGPAGGNGSPGATSAGGGGGQQSASNNGGVGSYPGANGIAGVGGAGAEGSPTFGNGGGGWFGGGGGAIPANGPEGGGGGGSSFVESGALNVSSKLAASSQCDASNNGCITISY